MKEYLESLQVFTDFKVLTDAPENPEKPTRNNIVQAMQWLVKDAAPGDCFFLHYSGHGAYVDDTTGDEADGKDETICPVDYAQAGMLIDDEMHKLLVEPLPKGAKMTVVFDCCHSGSGIDLPFTYSIDGKNEILFRDNRLVALESGMNAVKHLANKNVEAAMREAFSALSILKEKQPQPVQGPIKTSDADIVFFSGCKDTQTSADAHIEGAHTGAMSWALLKVLRENPALNLTELLKKLRETLQGKYQQIPQLSTGHMVDVVTKKFTVAY
ncbi:peptidase C14, caspase domain-containing protein [Gorgonomyces haynaldii]|nr:peptidase C14, caspase domain-containing protein [Gorgonomyces haynaldii]